MCWCVGAGEGFVLSQVNVISKKVKLRLDHISAEDSGCSLDLKFNQVKIGLKSSENILGRTVRTSVGQGLLTVTHIYLVSVMANLFVRFFAPFVS